VASKPKTTVKPDGTKLWSTFLRYRIASAQQTRVAHRAVRAATSGDAQAKLLDHVRTRPGWCAKCKRDSDHGHGKLVDPKNPNNTDGIPCDGSYASEAEAEVQSGGRAILIGDFMPAQDPITIEIGGQSFTYERPGDVGNKEILL